MKTTVSLQCIDKTLQPLSLPKLTSGGRQEVRVEFTFDSMWDGYGTTAIFYRDKSQVIHVLLENNACVVPWSVMAKPGKLYVGVYGAKGDTTRTSEVLALHVTQGAILGASDMDPTPDVYQQMLAAYDAMDQRVTNLATLEEGSTTGDAELQDIRLDVDRNRHANAGEAIRANQRARVVYITGDLNNYTAPICGLATNAANAPVSGTGFVMVDYAKTAATNDPWVIQRWYTYRGSRCFYRTLVAGTWSDWVDPGEALYKNQITDDLDNYYEEDIRAIVIVGAKNAPQDTDSGFLDVVRYSTGTNTWVVQKWRGLNRGHKFVRVRRAGVWGAWEADGLPGANTHGKVVVFLGDSIFGNNQTATGVVNLFGAYTGAACYNFAFGGTRAKARADANGWDFFDGENLAEAIAAGDFSNQVAALGDMTSVPSYFAGTLEKMQAFDFSLVDYFVCNYGTNDWTAGNTAEEYRVGLDNVMQTLQTAYPQAVFVKCTPTQRFVEDGGELVAASAYANPTSGITLRDIVNADKAATEAVGVPMVNLFDIGVNAYTKDVYFSDGDYTHHNEQGRRRVAECMARLIV